MRGCPHAVIRQPPRSPAHWPRWTDPTSDGFVIHPEQADSDEDTLIVDMYVRLNAAAHGADVETERTAIALRLHAEDGRQVGRDLTERVLVDIHDRCVSAG
ncbi:MAG: hypothetical protein ACLRL4_10520 [Bifidobacterium bifidum]